MSGRRAARRTDRSRDRRQRGDRPGDGPARPGRGRRGHPDRAAIPERLARRGRAGRAQHGGVRRDRLRRLAEFFEELPAPIDHVLVTGRPVPTTRPLAELDFDQARRGRRATSAAAARRWPAPPPEGPGRRNAGVHGRHRRPPDGGGIRVDLGADGRGSRTDEGPRARDRAGPREPDRGRLRRHAALGVDPRRPSWTRAASSCAGRCPSAASSARPTSPRWPCTS